MKCLFNTKAAPHSLSQFKKYFDVIIIDANCQYTPSEHFVFIDNRDNQSDIAYWTSRGFKVIVEKFWEQIVDDPRGSYVENNCLHLYSSNWVWFDLALYNQHQKYNYVRNTSTPDKFFLLLMNLRKPHRDQLFEATQIYHADSLYSYVTQGHLLQNDVPATGSGLCAGTSGQNFYNPTWYNTTAFSLVSESKVNGPRFISEKIFKPLAFQHAFLVYGTIGTLEYLHKLGFETFDNVIDESYDNLFRSSQRLQAINFVLHDLYCAYGKKEQLFADSISKQKIAHNFNHFYNIDRLWEKEIINPIKEFVNA